MNDTDPIIALEKLDARRKAEKAEAENELKKMGQDECNGDHADASFVYSQKSFYYEQVTRLGRVIEVAERMIRQLKSETGKVTCLDCGMDLNVWEMIASLARNSLPVHAGCRFGHGRRR